MAFALRTTPLQRIHMLRIWYRSGLDAIVDVCAAFLQGSCRAVVDNLDVAILAAAGAPAGDVDLEEALRAGDRALFIDHARPFLLAQDEAQTRPPRW